uniref:Uncharacterized protein n=1 Tax=Panagrolaimus davidi TaxID=227884 RepID=A0A914QSD2_9BILA
MDETQSSPAIAATVEDDDEEEEVISQKSEKDDETPTFLIPTTRRQNSVPGGRSLAQTGHEGTIFQGFFSPFIYCGAPPLQHTPINAHRRLMHHNSMRTPTLHERNNNNNNNNESSNNINNNSNNATRSLSGSRRLKRHDTDPSMKKNGKSKLSSPSTAPAMECYNGDGYLNVPIMSRGPSPSVGSVQSDPESCIDGYFYDDDDDSLISRFYFFFMKNK